MTPRDSATQFEAPEDQGASSNFTGEPPTLLLSNELHALDVVTVVAKHKRMIARVTGVTAIASVVIALVWPKSYTAGTKSLPPEENKSIANMMLGQLAPLASLAGAAGQEIGLKDPRDIYVAMLQSRTTEDALIKRFDLKSVYKEDEMPPTRERLEGSTQIEAGKDGLITVSFTDKDPKRAADLANAYIDELHKLTQTLAVSEASQRRLYFEGQLKQANEDLKGAEVELKKTQEKTGLLELDSQARMIMETVAYLNAQIAEKEVELNALRSFGTANNPDVVRTQQELATLRSQLSDLEHKQNLAPGDVLVPTGKLPSTGLEYVRKLRDVKYYETLFELLAQQYEISRIDETKNGTLIQVVEEAIPPERRSKPRRKLIVFMLTFIAFSGAMGFALFKELYERAKADPEQAARLEMLKRYASAGRGWKWLRI
jgi:tyrosine-protein kinase Etk/Wzc